MSILEYMLISIKAFHSGMYLSVCVHIYVYIYVSKSMCKKKILTSCISTKKNSTFYFSKPHKIYPLHSLALKKVLPKKTEAYKPRNLRWGSADQPSLAVEP